MAREYIWKWMFGEPTLQKGKNGDAVWARGYQAQSTHQKSPTGWVANLYGGTQTGDDWAAVYIPVNELMSTLFRPDSFQTKWSYYQTNTEVYGVNLVIWMHDPNDFDKRIEVTQAPSHADLEKAAGWNAHELDETVTQFFFFGENTSGTGLTAGTQYTWEQFQTDALFRAWTIYRISLEWGWYSTGTFEEAWVADIRLNGETVLLKPDSSGTGRIGYRHKVVTSGDPAFTLAPKTPFRLLNFNCEINTAGTTDESLTITKDSGNADTFDVLLATQNTKTPAVTSLWLPFGKGYEFDAWDEIDVAWPNTESRTIGITMSYQTVF